MSFVVAIHPDDYTNPSRQKHDDASSPRWAQYLEEAGCSVRWVDAYSPGLLQDLKGCDAFMWRWAHFWGMYRLAHRILPVIENELGLLVYPNQKTCWHYDDKAAQFYLLQAAGIWTPETWVFFSKERAHAWASTATYPVVHKLPSGAGSTNVSLVSSEDEAHRLINRLFNEGCFELVESSQVKVPFRDRVSNAFQVLRGGDVPSRSQPTGDVFHKSLIYFQQFIPNNSFDIRVTVIGNRAFAFRRMNRDNDFRASGSGHISFSPADIPPDAVRLAFDATRRLGCQSLAFDILINQDQAPVVVEISYTYASWAIHDCPGHWEQNEFQPSTALKWVEGPMWPERAQIDVVLPQLHNRRRASLPQS
jgi:glutathione synthase/RimK-type ligase-like ATP-grasp enzyme